MDWLRFLCQGEPMRQRRFGLYLKGLIDDREMSQERAATVLGVSEGLLSMLITGKSRPNLDTVKNWKSLLGLTEKEHQVLYRLAQLARSPTEVEDEYLKMLEKVTPLEEEDDEDGEDVSP